MPNVTLDQLARILERTATQMPRRVRASMQGSGQRTRDLARSYIGSYQGSQGPFPAWSSLADTTVVDRIAKGYSPDEPLLRDGTLRASIQYTVTPNAVGGYGQMVVFSREKIAMWQEFGTSRTGWGGPIPPRSFIGRAMAERGRTEAFRTGWAAFRPLMTGRP